MNRKGTIKTALEVVGPSIALGSQEENGNCADLIVAETTSIVIVNNANP